MQRIIYINIHFNTKVVKNYTNRKTVKATGKYVETRRKSKC